MAIYVANNGQLQTIKGIYYAMTEDYINATLFHNLVPKTATEIKFLYASNNPDLTDYQRIGYCDNNNFIEVWNNGTKYILINPKKNYIYAPVNCNSFLDGYTSLITCIFDNFNTENVTNMQFMFQNCSSLTSLDVSSFNTQNVTSMHVMFRDCVKLTNLNLSSFNTANVTVMSEMFFDCFKLTSLNLSSFNTANVTQMQYMFYKCFSLSSLDLRSFNTQNLTRMVEMFYSCVKLTSILCNTFNKTSLVNSERTFLNCPSLVGGNGTPYSSAHTDAKYARVDGEDGLPGYFTAPN